MSTPETRAKTFMMATIALVVFLVFLALFFLATHEFNEKISAMENQVEQIEKETKDLLGDFSATEDNVHETQGKAGEKLDQDIDGIIRETKDLLKKNMDDLGTISDTLKQLIKDLKK